jgi:hypothetical protein
MYANSHTASRKDRMSQTELDLDATMDLEFLAYYTNQQGPQRFR